MVGNSAKDKVLRERVQALCQQQQTDLTDSTLASTSEQHDHRDLLARTRHQLQRLNPSRLSPRVRGLILLNILVLLCGANWVVLKETGDFFDPFTFAALRFTLAAAVFFPWVKNAAKDRKVLKGGLELGIYSALAYQTQSVGLITSDASRASFISTFTVGSLSQHRSCMAAARHVQLSQYLHRVLRLFLQQCVPQQGEQNMPGSLFMHAYGPAPELCYCLSVLAVSAITCNVTVCAVCAGAGFDCPHTCWLIRARSEAADMGVMHCSAHWCWTA